MDDFDERTAADEDGLAARAGGGDADAFRALVRRCYDRIYRWALVQTGRPADADDVTQHVLIRLHDRLGSFRGEARFTTWLYRVTRNVVAERRRKHERRRALLEAALPEPAPPPAGPEDALDRARLLALVQAFFEALPARQREVFDLVDLQGYTPAEVAELLGLPPPTVRANLFKARQAIRTRILAHHPDLIDACRP